MEMVEGEYFGGEEEAEESGFDPSHENYYYTANRDGQRMVFDGKRMRKAIVRKTVDYNSCIISHIENRIFQRDYRDRGGFQCIPSYQVKMETPSAYLDNPNNSICTKFVHTSTNKVKCPINCVTWTPEGRRLITGASSGEFTLWNGLTFNFETILQAHDSAVRSMVWSHNDQWMVTGDHDGMIKYWQANMNNVKAFTGHKEAIRDISFSPTDMKFATCSDDVSIKIWDFARCTEENVLTGHGWDVKAVDWHPIISLIASGSKDNLVKLWDPKTAKNVTTLHGHKNTILAVDWNANGNWLLTASRDQLLKLFDLRTMKELQTFRGHKREVTVAAWHPIHEDMFASASYDGSILYWRVGMEEPQGSLQAHEGSIWDIAWHPLGHILCSGSNDHTTKFWCRSRPGDNIKGASSASATGEGGLPVGGGPGLGTAVAAPAPAPASTQSEKYEPTMPTGMFDDTPQPPTMPAVTIPGLVSAPMAVPMHHFPPPPLQGPGGGRGFGAPDFGYNPHMPTGGPPAPGPWGQPPPGMGMGMGMGRGGPPPAIPGMGMFSQPPPQQPMGRGGPPPGMNMGGQYPPPGGPPGYPPMQQGQGYPPQQGNWGY